MASHGTCHQAAQDTWALGNGTCKEQGGSWETGVTHPKGKGSSEGQEKTRVEP